MDGASHKDRLAAMRRSVKAGDPGLCICRNSVAGVSGGSAL